MRLPVALAAAITVGIGLAPVAKADLDSALTSIDEQCGERAAEAVSEQWPAIQEGAEERGLEVTPRHRAAHEQVLTRRCELSERIELVDGIRDDLTEEEWDDFGGDALLEELRLELQQLQDES